MAASLESDVEVLAQVGFFEGFSDAHLKLVAFSAENRTLPDKLLLYDEGQLLHSAYVVVSGLLRGRRKTRDGDDGKGREIGPGSILGEHALILDVRADEAVRVESRARVLQIRKVQFRRLLQEHPELAVTLRSRLMSSVLKTAGDLGLVGQRLRAIAD